MSDNKIKLKLHALIMRINALYYDGVEYSSMKKNLALFLKNIKVIFAIDSPLFTARHKDLDTCLLDLYYSDANAELFFQAVKHYQIFEEEAEDDTLYHALEALSLLEHDNTLLVVSGLYKLQDVFQSDIMRVRLAEKMWENRKDVEKLNMVIKLCKSKK